MRATAFHASRTRTATRLRGVPKHMEGRQEQEKPRPGTSYERLGSEEETTTSTDGTVARTKSSWRRWAVPLAIGATVGAGAAVAATHGDVDGWTKRVEELSQEAGVWGPVYFGGAYTLATVLFFPASVLTLAAGYLYGPVKGTALVSLASTTGAAVAFGLSRTVLRPYVAKKLEDYPKFGAVDRAVSAEGGKVVLLLRLSPLFPFSLSNYMFGLTSIDFLPYIGASWLGMLPGTFAYVYLGKAGKAAYNAGTGGIPPEKLILYGIGVAATILVTKTISSAASRALQETTDQQS